MLQRLQEMMTKRIRMMLRTLLEEYRSQEYKSREPLNRLFDTTLANVMVAERNTAELSSFLQGEHHCDMDNLEPHLGEMRCYDALLRLKRQQNNWPETLHIITRLIDGELIDPTFHGSLQDVVHLLGECPDADLVHQYSLWLIQRDSEAGIKLLTKDKSSDSGRNQQSTLEELRAIDERAADAYLEFTALSKKQHTAEAHMELAHLLINRLGDAFGKQEEREFMEKVTQDYRRGQYAESFVAHMALQWDQTSTIVQRLKLIMLLQGSSVIDAEKVLEWIQQQPLLLFEKAILLGKLQKDTDALEVLAIHLCDANSAEIYCNQNRSALSSVQLQSLAIELKELVLYANFYAKSLKKTSRDNKIKLFKNLLQVYMEKGVGNEFQIATSHLLNTQSLNLSPLEVLNLVPNHWPLSILETFLSRSLRKEMHKSNEGQIQRNVALAQNLEVAELLWAKRRGLGGVIEDGTEGDDEIALDTNDPIVVDDVILEKPFLAGVEKSDIYEVQEDNLV